MINTIFYFPESLTFEDYTNLFTSGEISKNTIVFAKEQRSIYMGGDNYTGKEVTPVGAEGGIALLDENGKIPVSQLPEDVFTEYATDAEIREMFSVA